MGPESLMRPSSHRPQLPMGGAEDMSKVSRHYNIHCIILTVRSISELDGDSEKHEVLGWTWKLYVWLMCDNRGLGVSAFELILFVLQTFLLYLNIYLLTRNKIGS